MLFDVVGADLCVCPRLTGEHTGSPLREVFLKTFFTALRVFLILTILTGVVYPLLITGVARFVWPAKAGGSLVTEGGQVIGSLLIAQKFSRDSYFWPRPSAAEFNAAASTGSNRGPTNADLKKAHDEGISRGLTDEMIFASASGLDPHISPQAALAQIDRVASARNLLPAKDKFTQLVKENIEERDLGFLGEPRVNVLKLNLALDELFGP